MNKKLIFGAFLILLFNGFSASAQNYEEDFDNFVLALMVDDSAEVRKYFESDDMYNQCAWEIFQPEFVLAILDVDYADLKDDYVAGEKVKQHELIMNWEMVENGETIKGTSTIVLFFKETEEGLKMIDFFRPEGTDAP